jgi:hypothetical protein
MSLVELFFKVLSFYLAPGIRIQIRIKVKGRIRIQIRINVKGRIRSQLHIKVKGRIRICIKGTSRIRIRVVSVITNPRNYAKLGSYCA